MVKTIKFNLILDKNPVRDLNGLTENFNIDDILTYYGNGLLKKWLFCKGYTEELSKIEAIKSKDYREIIRELIKIFIVNIESHQLEELFYSFDLRTQWRARLAQIEKSNFQHQAVIKSYCDGYDSLLRGMLEDKDNIALVKNSMKQISENYIDVFIYNSIRFYDDFLEKAPLAIFASLMNPTLRKVFFDFDPISKKIRQLTTEISCGCPDNFIYEEFKEHISLNEIFYRNDTDYSWRAIEYASIKCLVLDLTDRYDVMVAHHNINLGKFKREEAIGKVFNGLSFCSNNYNDFVKYIPLSNESENKEIIIRKLFYLTKEHIKKRNLNTKEYWEDIEPKGKKCMIIGMREGNFVRNACKQGETLSADDVNGKFPILDGIDYKSNNSEHEIGYLEV
ncbi:hypothetical protein [Nostoc sp. ChiSLP03a]|uniref:hypothetical protein n=1 Tax=Nostoc sp. ChiSLP03a TaxID=3075380 RepID=UPI002AD4E1E9|nr:hypothetical protein [Nostoc sp. ChiSLP03a]MDZ8213588.1 hypothetical protein [Nostoc sp. ChiSLP03a]